MANGSGGKSNVTVVALCSTAVTVAALAFAAVILMTVKDASTALTIVVTIIPLTVGTLVTALINLVRTEEIRHNVNGRMTQMVDALANSTPQSTNPERSSTDERK